MIRFLFTAAYMTLFWGLVWWIVRVQHRAAAREWGQTNSLNARVNQLGDQMAALRAEQAHHRTVEEDAAFMRIMTAEGFDK